MVRVNIVLEGLYKPFNIGWCWELKVAGSHDFVVGVAGIKGQDVLKHTGSRNVRNSVLP
jgi:hypothetical protein